MDQSKKSMHHTCQSNEQYIYTHYITLYLSIIYLSMSIFISYLNHSKKKHYELWKLPVTFPPKKLADGRAMAICFPFTRQGDGGDQALQARGLVVDLGPRDAPNARQSTKGRCKKSMEHILWLNYMIYKWFIYGLYMVCIWFTYGIKYDLYMV